MVKETIWRESLRKISATRAASCFMVRLSQSEPTTSLSMFPSGLSVTAMVRLSTGWKQLVTISSS